ncbi:hypothetical protein Prum_045430 [Phytohabitans rumicis]|uniref:Uncharacterized protein n=2 Tax=Phytohabitans rumicis TaxID=1076125 RepID=A0A6V8L7W0_9ACTN|nr:hypothetical protein Prum_045430 [Phytohabitans rumicis]
MGNGNGGTPPDGGGRPEGVPDLPPEWGTVVIPDDARELAEESAAIRRELRKEVNRSGWRRLFGWPSRAGAAETSLRVPLLIMAVAVLATLTSLFAVAWPGQRQPPAVQQTAAGPSPSHTLPALDLIDVDGATVALRGLLPAAVLLTDGCDCDGLVADTAAAARPGVTVVTVTKATAPPPRANTPRAPGSGAPVVRTLTDPAGGLRTHLQLGTQGPGSVATVVLVARTGEILAMRTAVTSIEQIRADLARLV